jgi:tetratricopeptide (TPR) repeat protein
MSKIKPSQKRKCKKHVSRPGILMLNQCRNTIRNHTASPSTFFNYAGELFKLGNTAGALKYYRKGLKRNPDDINALVNMSLILIALSEYVQAIIYLTKAIVLSPDQYFAYIYRSLAYVGVNKKAEAYQDFKFVYVNYQDKIQHFMKMDKMKYPQIDFDQAIEYSLYPDAFVHLRPNVYFPTVDCPVDEICLLKEFCLQKDVCPQNDMAVFKEIITRQKLAHPGKYRRKTVLPDLGEDMAISGDPTQPEIVSDLDLMETFRSETASGNFEVVPSSPNELPESGFRKPFLYIPHRKYNFRKLFQNIQNFKTRLISIFGFLFLFLVLPLNEVLLEYEVIIDI